MNYDRIVALILNYNWHLNLKYCGALSLDANCNGLLIQGQKLQFSHSSGTIAPIYSSPYFYIKLTSKKMVPNIILEESSCLLFQT